MRVLSWNVNGLRACVKKGFLDWLSGCGADVVGLQEIRARSDQLTEPVRSPDGWSTSFCPAHRPGYSGVGIYSRRVPDAVDTSLGVDEFDAEGRLQIARFGRLKIANVYFPNGSGKDRDNSRIPFKLNFYARLFDMLEEARRTGEALLVIGDFNTAHQAVDLARPKQNGQTSGFCPEEREELDRWIRAGWVDTFRARHSEGGNYTWWSNRKGVRERNVGWRIDYVLASEGALPFVRDAYILPDVMGSDHCPLGVDLDPAIVDHVPRT